MKLVLDDVVAAVDGRLVQGVGPTDLGGVSTDTRSVEPGELFIALRGENHDAHDYLDAAASKGAGAAIVDRWPVDCPADWPVIQVEDTTQAYGALAAWWRAQMPARVVGITGSNGKTTTKEMIACLLDELGPTVASVGNHNNHIGVPETLLRIRSEHAFAIVELGTNHPGEIPQLAALVRPDVAVITNIGPSHLEYFGSERGVQREKGSLLTFIEPDGLAVLHAAEDDPWSHELAVEHPGRVTTFGTSIDATWSADDVELGTASIAFRLSRSDVTVSVPVVGRFQVDNCLAAIAVADELGLTPQEAARRLRHFRPPKMRMNLHAIGDLTLLEDCYNANPASTRAALDELLRRPAPRHVAVFGDMLELGGVADAEHHALGELAAARGVDLLVAVGERAPIVAEAARRHGIPDPDVLAAEDAPEAIHWLARRLAPTDAVLVKGSRGIRLERVAEAIVAWARAHAPSDPNPGAEQPAEAVGATTLG